MTALHDGSDERPVRIGVAPVRVVTMCKPCREAAAKLGMIDRSER